MVNLMLHRLQPSHGAVNFILAQLYTVVNTDILQAQAHLNLGEYEWVVPLAEAGLGLVQAINSEAIVARVEKIYRQLKASPYKESSDVARLDYRLRSR
jgi:hypothetical protein